MYRYYLTGSQSHCTDIWYYRTAKARLTSWSWKGISIPIPSSPHTGGAGLYLNRLSPLVALLSGSQYHYWQLLKTVVVTELTDPETHPSPTVASHFQPVIASKESCASCILKLLYSTIPKAVSWPEHFKCLNCPCSTVKYAAHRRQTAGMVLFSSFCSCSSEIFIKKYIYLCDIQDQVCYTRTCVYICDIVQSTRPTVLDFQLKK